jgi:hypothetical protein
LVAEIAEKGQGGGKGVRNMNWKRDGRSEALCKALVQGIIQHGRGE